MVTTDMTSFDDEAVPVFLEKAQADHASLRTRRPGAAQDRKYATAFRRELEKLGTATVSAAWDAQTPVMSWDDPFAAVRVGGRSPSMLFVRTWLDAEDHRRRMLLRVTFWATLAATVGSAFAAIYFA